MASTADSSEVATEPMTSALIRRTEEPCVIV